MAFDDINEELNRRILAREAHAEEVRSAELAQNKEVLSKQNTICLAD